MTAEAAETVTRTTTESAPARRWLANISLLGLAQVAKMALRLGAFVIIARTLEPARYGSYVTVVAFVDFFTLFTFPGITKPLVREGCRSPGELSAILGGKIGLRYALSVMALVLCNISVLFTDYPHALKILVLVYSSAVVLESLQAYFRITFKVHERFHYLAYVEVFQAGLFTAMAVTVVLMGLGITALVLVSLSSIAATVALDLRLSRRLVTFPLWGRIDLERSFLTASVVFTLTNIFWLLVTRTDVLMLTFMGTPEDVGVYHVANRLIGTAMIAVSAISMATYPMIVKRLHGGPLDLRRYRRLAVQLAIGLPLAAFLLSRVSHLVITGLLGDEYAASVGIFNVLLTYLLIQAVATPLTLVLQATDNERGLLLATVPLPLLNIGGNYLLYQQFGLYGIAYSTILVYSAYVLLVVAGHHRLLKEALFSSRESDAASDR